MRGEIRPRSWPSTRLEMEWAKLAYLDCVRGREISGLPVWPPIRNRLDAAGQSGRPVGPTGAHLPRGGRPGDLLIMWPAKRATNGQNGLMAPGRRSRIKWARARRPPHCHSMQFDGTTGRLCSTPAFGPVIDLGASTKLSQARLASRPNQSVGGARHRGNKITCHRRPTRCERAQIDVAEIGIQDRIKSRQFH